MEKHQVWIEYRGWDEALDDRICKIGRKLRGHDFGSGFGFGYRDRSFFASASAAAKLQTAFRAELKRSKVRGRVRIVVPD